ncbi:type I restriction endonuclease EcoAI subunit S [Pseudodesulfovibrio nedwellii]|uniref:Type I restriction endonuclease EcoAI subunit S n=1 Tax=Pseudodesulfovibrio nedwellii TaxID=2973072 RepID=A0ABN6S649_9BACT|nr:restriction endonuclease subunit S [Pseudodesulfovibrio nedwellii]BDQ38764.1 type I restriction endonuclease EcoAI subunit S [Pseudodesulfovibrio nedwellii]
MELLEKHFDTAFAAPDGIKKLRELILTLAMQGKLVEQDPNDQPASELLKEIEAEKARLVKEKKIKKPKQLAKIKADEVPYALPAGWEWGRFGDLVLVLNGRAYKKNELLDSGTPVLRVGNLFTSKQWYYSDLTLDEDKYINSEDLIYAWSASFGPFIWEGGKAIYHYHIWKLKFFIEGSPYKEYLYNYLLDATDRIKRAGSGIAMIHMTKGRMEELLVPLPPLAEQHRIVAKIDQLMARCDELEKLRIEQEQKRLAVHTSALKQLLDAQEQDRFANAWKFLTTNFGELYTVKENVVELRKAILQLAVMGKLVEQDPSDQPASELLMEIEAEKARLLKEKKVRKVKPLPEFSLKDMPYALPERWEWVRLEDVVELGSGVTKGRKLAGKKLISIPYLRVANVQRGYLDLAVIKEIEIVENEVEKYSLKYGDLLITEGGDWDKVGRTCLWREEVPVCGHQNHIFRARKVLNKQNENWLEKCLNSPISRQYFAGASKQTTNLASINKTQLRGCPIPMPPLTEQRRIVEKLDQLMTLCDDLEHQIDTATNTQNNLLNAVMAQV